MKPNCYCIKGVKSHAETIASCDHDFEFRAQITSSAGLTQITSSGGLTVALEIRFHSEDSLSQAVMYLMNA